MDRDSYDVILDDGDTQRQVQLKTVLKTAKTASWSSTKRFMRLEEVYGDRLGMSPGDCGVGGAFILIEIDDEDDLGNVTYLYTGYYVLQALVEQIVREKSSRRAYKSFGKPAKDRADFAADFMAEIQRGSSRDPIILYRKHFLRVQRPNDLLILLGLHAVGDVHLPCDHVMMAVTKGFAVDQNGTPSLNVSVDALMLAQLEGEELMSLINEPLLTNFTR